MLSITITDGPGALQLITDAQWCELVEDCDVSGDGWQGGLTFLS